MGLRLDTEPVIELDEALDSMPLQAGPDAAELDPVAVLEAVEALLREHGS